MLTGLTEAEVSLLRKIQHADTRTQVRVSLLMIAGGVLLGGVLLGIGILLPSVEARGSGVALLVAAPVVGYVKLQVAHLYQLIGKLADLVEKSN